MKKIFLPLIAVFCYSFLNAQVQLPQASPNATIIQNFGIGKITLVYSRPSIKGRTLFMNNSDLAPLGKLWRTGANAATRLSFTEKVKIWWKRYRYRFLCVIHHSRRNRMGNYFK
jgi:hypothetical protein